MRLKAWQRIIRTLAAMVAVTSGILVIWSCENPSGQLKGNSTPDTRIANIPPSDTFAVYFRLGTIPEQTLYWSGGDPDGYIIAYRYRWIDSTRGGSGFTTPYTTILNATSFGNGSELPNTVVVKGTPSSLLAIYHYLQTVTDADTVRMIGDSLVTRRTFGIPIGNGLPGDSIFGGDPDANQTPNKGTFIFSSFDSANVHKFEIASVDNNEVEDPTPAYVFFWTQKAPEPTALFAAVTRDTLVLRQVNDRFRGLSFTFTTKDPSTFIQEYSWAVDDTLNPLPPPPAPQVRTPRWTPWNSDAFAIVTASHFLDLRTDDTVRHTIFLRAKNRWGVVSETIDTTFVTILPAIDDPLYPTRILIINNDKIGTGFPDTNQINSFYRGILSEIGKPDSIVSVWTTSSQRNGNLIAYRIPPRTVLSRYRVVLFIYEQQPAGFANQDVQRAFNTAKQATMLDYLNIGGKLIFSSPPNLEASIPSFYGQPTFWGNNVFHIQFTLMNTTRDFIGSKGVLGYPTIKVDSLKLPADSAGAIRNISINFPRSLAQTISFFDSRRDSAAFENQPLGIRYRAPERPPLRQTYSMVWPAFPLYYGERDAVKEAIRQAFRDINEYP